MHRHYSLCFLSTLRSLAPVHVCCHCDVVSHLETKGAGLRDQGPKPLSFPSHSCPPTFWKMSDSNLSLPRNVLWLLGKWKKYIKQIFPSLNCLLGKQEGFSSSGQWPYASDLPQALLHVLVFTCLYNLGRVGPGREIWGEWLLFNILTDCVSQAPHHLILRVAFSILAMTLLRGETCRVLFSCSHILLTGHLLQKNNLFSILRECRTLVYLLPLQNVHGLHTLFPSRYVLHS